MSFGEILPILPNLEPKTVLSILTQAAYRNPDVCAIIAETIVAERAAQGRRVLTFPYESSEVWHEINTKYSGLSGSKQYNMSGDVCNMIADTIEGIMKQCGPLANPRTRYNGLAVLRKIGKTICLSATDTLGHEVQKDFQWRKDLEEGMLQIVEAMSMSGRWEIMEEQEGAEALWVKLLELDALREGHCVFRV
ncbi:hypothetical protein BJY04DRAFT_224921 [Aspergillus karnatakaensis]|uniref:uncharacterized protein n=1 Tax=Aspergillus karnatakaensis TaxID=1810916 RepID=UPI003CCE3AF7